MSEKKPPNVESPNHGLGISPDPKIKISATGIGTSTVTFKRTDTNWQYATVDNPTDGDFQDYVGELQIDPGGGDGFENLSVTVERDREAPVYTNAEIMQQHALSSDQTTFDIGAEVNDTFEVRLFKADERLSRPVSQSYFIRSARTHVTDDNRIAYYFAYISDEQDQTLYVNFGDHVPLDSAFRWLFVGGTARGGGDDTEYYLIQSAVGYAPPNFTQSSSLSSYITFTQSYDDIAITAWLLDMEQGTIQATSNTEGYWSALNADNDHVALPTSLSADDPSTTWNLVPVEFGPHWTGLGVLGPKVSTISTVDDQLDIHYSTYTIMQSERVQVYNNSGQTVSYSATSGNPLPPGSSTIDSGSTAQLGAGTWYFQATIGGTLSEIATLTIGTHSDS